MQGDRGWICPRCNAVNAPSVVQCSCSPAMQPAAPQVVPVFVPYVPTYQPAPLQWDTIICSSPSASWGSVATRTDIKVTQ